MTTSQQRRQWHQLDNDGSKKEARFTGLGIKERERERERKRGERESDTNWSSKTQLFSFLISHRLGRFLRVREKKLMTLCLLPLESITHIFGLGFGFCYWVFFPLSLFVLGVCVDGGKRIGLLLVLLKMDWWVCVCILAGSVYICVCVLAGFVYVFLLDLVFVF